MPVKRSLMENQNSFLNYQKQKDTRNRGGNEIIVDETEDEKLKQDPNEIGLNGMIVKWVLIDWKNNDELTKVYLKLVEL